MKPTEQLKEEHKAIKLMLKVLEKVCEMLQKNERVKPDDIDKIIDFIRTFADRCHHGKEEDLLFPAFEELGIPKEGGPIGVMLSEHEMGRSYLRGMNDAFSRYRTGDEKASVDFVKNARGYISLLTDHIYKEDNILYPMGEMRLSMEKEKELLENFEKIERERIGPGKHEEYHRLLHHLSEVYLGEHH